MLIHSNQDGLVVTDSSVSASFRIAVSAWIRYASSVILEKQCGAWKREIKDSGCDH